MTDSAETADRLNVAANMPGPREARLDEMMRVDHAGEYGAVQIYRGQRAVFDALPHKRRTAELLRDMEQGEQHHLAAFDKLLMARGVRPTALAPIWNVAGYALGAATALMGEKAAMACTTAVEEVIEQHYQAQIDELEDDQAAFRDMITEFREDEIEHKETANAEGAKEALAYPLLSSVIKAGCRFAIKVSEKV